MPGFEFNPLEVSAGIPVYPKGSYEVELGEPKTFARPGKNGKVDNFGLMFVSKIVDCEDPKFKGKRFIVNLFFHTPESISMSKVAIMAAYGFKKNQEDEFNEAHALDDWKLNTDDGTIGDAYREMSGKIIIYDLDTTPNQDTGEPQQKTVGMRPFSV